MSQNKPRQGQHTDGATAIDLEARVVVLEIVSMTALALAMDTSENADIEHGRGISSLVREAVHQRCHEMNMPEGARLAACTYADELLSTALLSLYPQEH